MNRNNKWVVLFIALQVVSCAGADDKEGTKVAAAPADNHLYFLSIGNAHYDHGADGNTDFLLSESGANTSADYFSRFLSCYGHGAVLNSTKNRVLSKEIISAALDSMIDVAVKDSLSTTFIYYCGHGISDGAGNIYIVPGNFHGATVLASLLPILAIQQKIIAATNAAYPADTNAAKDPGVMRADSIMQQRMAEIVRGNRSIDQDELLKDVNIAVEKYVSRFRRPRFVLIADCCTEDEQKVNYGLFVDKEINSAFAEPEKRMSGVMPGIKQIVQSKLLVAKYNISQFKVKNQMWQHGNRTIYTAEAGKLADMVRSPIDREEKVGPVCGRLALFFNNTTQSFDLSQMMLHLGDEKLDTLAPSPKFEDGNGGKAFGKSLHYYKARIGADPDIRKRDSVVFVCGRK